MLESYFTPEQILQLKKDFKALTTIEEKFSFWISTLKKPYFHYSFVDFQTIKDFFIKPKNNEETRVINELTLEEIQIYGAIYKLKLFSYCDAVENLDDKLFKVKNKKAFLENELSRLREEVEKHGNLNKSNRLQSQSGFWLHGYNQSYTERGELDLTGSTYDARNLVALYNGFGCGEYHKHIDELIEDVKNNRESSSRPRTSIRQQLLILENLGLLRDVENLFAKQSSRGLIKKDFIHFLSVFLNVGEQGVKEAYTDLPKKAEQYNIKTHRNYDFLIELFSKVGLNQSSENVGREKDKLKSKNSTP